MAAARRIANPDYLTDQAARATENRPTPQSIDPARDSNRPVGGT